MTRGRYLWLILAWAGLPAAARAHGDSSGFTADARPRSWGELGQTWGFEWPVVVPLVVTGAVYALGVWRMWRKAGAGRGIRPAEVACFAGGWLALAVALVSPLHPWGNVLFSAHMAQHELLMLAAAPLLVLSKPVVATLTAVPATWARWLSGWTRAGWWQGTWAVVSGLMFAGVAHAVVLWVWHVPVLFRAALHSGVVHAAQHLTFTLSAVLFWWALLHGPGKAFGYGAGVLYLFATTLHTGLLGALLTIAPTVWYPEYLATTAPWGLTPLEDQQIGGLIMWVPACSVYIVAALALFAAWLRAADAGGRWPSPALVAPEGSTR
jgi:cytochrome c oxidase assembly factor CtaG